MARQTTQTKIGFNTKIEAVNMQPIQPASAGLNFVEGQPIALDASGNGVVADGSGYGASGLVFMNFVDSGRSDVSRTQTDPFSDGAPSISMIGGGLTGIVGNGVDLGLPAECWDGGALPAVGELVTVNTTSGLFQGTTAADNVQHHGVVYRVYQNRAFFHFQSSPVRY